MYKIYNVEMHIAYIHIDVNVLVVQTISLYYIWKPDDLKIG